MNERTIPLIHVLRALRIPGIVFVLVCACKGRDKPPPAPTTGGSAVTDTKAPVPETPPPAAAMKFSPTGRRLIDASLYVAQPTGGKPTPQRLPDIDQDKLLNGGYSLAEVLEAGQNQFNQPFDPEHGWGEGAAGPRSKQRAVWNSRGGIGSYTAWPFLRVNGIDSQSCFECHSSIGQYTPPGAKTVAQVRKPGAQGGPAGAANSAFINDQFPEALSQLTMSTGAGQPVAVLTKFVRNPPVVFGTGYTQRLATEMTTDLLAQQDALLYVAQMHPGQPLNVTLMSKGLKFGTLSATCTSQTSCTLDRSKVTGVQPDLIVRPFQWGGIASSVRHFARDALDFHFSVQAVEKVGSMDCDGDGLINEITVGNVTALTAYVTMFRPPLQIIPAGQDMIVKRGQQLLASVGCTSCHSDQMMMDNPTLTVMTPPSPPTTCPQEVSSLIDPVGKDGSDSVKQAMLHIAAARKAPEVAALLASKEATPDAIYAAMKPHLADPRAVAAGNYQIDLNLTGIQKNAVPAYVWPRLSAKDNKTPIPLYSDLRLHFMGMALADNYPQPTDSDNPIYVAKPGVYVTRVLWGIHDTAPYMHDGRARTLAEAIMMHGANGSEAQTAYQKFAALSADDQAALIAFLDSLQLPVSQGITATEYVNQ